MRLALPLTIAMLGLGLMVGCGGGDSSGGSTEGGAAAAPSDGSGAPPGASSRACGGESLRVTGVACSEAKAVIAAWRAAPGCRLQEGSSHASCMIERYVCIAARQGEDAAVSCARPGHSILFVPPR